MTAARTFVRQNWRRALQVRERLRFSEEAFHLVLAGIVGVIGGLTNLFFYLSIESVQKFALRHTGDLVEIAAVFDPWRRVLTPTLGGLAAGLVLYWGLRLVKRQGTAHLLEVVVAGDGRLPFRTGLLKAVSSLMSIGTGSSIGREGGIVQTTAVFASKLGQVAHWQPYRLRLLVACGAAAGMAAAYNAPVSGAVFAALIVLGNFSMTSFAPLVFASVIATMVSRSFFGIEPLYHVPSFDFTYLSQLPWFLLLGVLSGVVGAMFLKMLAQSEPVFARLRCPLYVRMMVGGLVVGLIALQFPEVWGNGYSTTNRILSESLAWHFLVGLFLAKLLATLAAVGSGTVGGVFTPTLYLGAALGSMFGALLHQAGMGGMLPTGAFALVGMGSVLSATLHSPLMAMIMVFEISLNYSVMPPLMLACAVSSLVARQLHPASVYTEPLRLKGLENGAESTSPGAATEKTVGDLMRSPVPPLSEVATLPEMADRFLSCTYNFLPVVDPQERLRGVVALQDLKEYLNAGTELKAVIAMDVMRPIPPCLTPNQRLMDVLPVLLASEQRNIPVVSTLTDYRLVGALGRAEAMALISEAMAVSRAAKT